MKVWLNIFVSAFFSMTKTKQQWRYWPLIAPFSTELFFKINEQGEMLLFAKTKIGRKNIEKLLMSVGGLFHALHVSYLDDTGSTQWALPELKVTCINCFTEGNIIMMTAEPRRMKQGDIWAHFCYNEAEKKNHTNALVYQQRGNVTIKQLAITPQTWRGALWGLSKKLRWH